MSAVTSRDYEPMRLNILIPVYNEERRLEPGVRKAASFLEAEAPGRCKITIVDNASTDRTRDIAQRLVCEVPHVEYLFVAAKGVGAAIREGLRANDCPLVGYMDVDLSTDVCHLIEVLDIFESSAETDMVNGSRWNEASDTSGRKWYRNITSHGLSFVLRAFLGMRATDAICGFKFFRKSAADRLVLMADPNENGWFFVIEMLLRAERSDMVVRELPVRWRDDHDSTVEVVQVTKNYLQHIRRLRKVFKEEGRTSGR